ncbi:MAG: T9SS type A sorting domain-containing protein [Bacteroidales bacterium]|nr:T9SS type A sorting domain-containing protein [Bacteroidales bacterium]MCF8457706.1 T9SS type A sorting domain-containing protein [Bacteroidales bacterium]
MKKLKYSTIVIMLWLFTGANVYAENNKWEHNNQTGLKSTHALTAGCAMATTSTELNLNNVRALIHTGGDMWWDLQGNPKYEIPKNSEKTALFAGSIWIGGEDVNGQLKLSALKFRANGTDYWPGPLIVGGPDQGTTTSDVCLEYDKHFTITRNEVAQFVGWYNADQETRASEYPGYSIPSIILDWPAHGDVANGYDRFLAPFIDVNGDEYYDPYSGDYPLYDLEGEMPCGTTRKEDIPRLFGDQTLWWVYNDRGNIHTETQGDAIGMEIRAQAFAFSTNDELNDMTFYNYRLINRSTYTLYETYFGVWTDADMGYAQDDYVGCDVNRGLGYLYNGEAVDGNGQYNAYGGPTPPPPAIGIDFFEGPYQDKDFLDNPSSWDPITGKLICDGNILNGNINGLNFGDGVVDNERWGMRRFLYFNNGGSGPMVDPKDAPDFYNYLRGIWLDGTNMVYGGTGHRNDSEATDIPTDFMFPGDTDPCGWGQKGQQMPVWSEEASDNPAGDRRFVHSAGPFTLEPGASNNITTGAVWARATGGNPFQSVEDVRIADDKAQLLFDNCFKVVNGPDSPDLDFIELDRQVVFHISNKIQSNNYLEHYNEKDFSIVNIIVNDEVIDVDKYYRFEGYQVFQLKSKSVSIGDIRNINLAREVFQCDVKNDVEQLVNYTWSKELQANIPQMMVTGANEGIHHSFTITNDAFAQGDDRLVNHKKYYFAIIAYGYNNYMTYDQNDGSTVKGQKLPYKAGRKGATGAIEIYEVIPHIPQPRDGGTIINSEYGDGLAVTQWEGFGSGPNLVNLKQETIDKILEMSIDNDSVKLGKPYTNYLGERKYEPGFAPIQVKVVDPLNIPDGEFIIAFDPDSSQYNQTGSAGYWDWKINDTKWFIYDKDTVNPLFDTIYSNEGIKIRNEQIIKEIGLSVIIEYQGYVDEKVDGEVDPSMGIMYYTQYHDPVQKNWLSFIYDGDDFNSLNWIRAGTQEDPNEKEYNDYFVGNQVRDKEESFEKILFGSWAPYKLASNILDGPGNPDGQALITFTQFRLSSIDLVITKNKDLWTRACVIEMSENDTSNSGVTVPALFGQGNAFKFDLRDTFSVDKEGVFADVETASTDENDPNFIAGKGMGWFPGYAIDIETGTRLNIAFGEASELPGENGRDMRWNPTARAFSNFGEERFGGKHVIYVIGQNTILKSNHVDTSVYMPAYDGGKRFYQYVTGKFGTTKRKDGYRNIMWCSIPVLSGQYYGKDFFTEVLPESDYHLSIRMANPHRAGYKNFAPKDSMNNGFPMFSINTHDVMAIKNDKETAENMLDKINIVPNPYYGYSEYELNQLENLAKITNLPQKCTISIYNVGGTLVRRFKKDNSLSYQDWDLKNQYGITIASGVYIIHIDADGIGEKILKWFGALRPIDLNAF